MRITVLSGGSSGARFLRGLVDHLDDSCDPETAVTVVVNTGDDISLWGLRMSPDLDAHLAALGETSGAQEDATGVVRDQLGVLGLEPDWYPVTDREVATHLARTAWLGRGDTLSEVTARLARQQQVPQRVTLLPMSDVPVETHAVLDGDEAQQAIHVQQWRHLPTPATPARFIVAGMDRAAPSAGVLDAVRGADLVLLAPGDPVLSLGVLLAVPGVRDAVRGTTAPVVGVSPGGVPALIDSLATLEPGASGAGPTTLYRDLLDGWLAEPGEVLPSPRGRWTTREAGSPISLDSPAAAARTAADALALGRKIGAT